MELVTIRVWPGGGGPEPQPTGRPSGRLEEAEREARFGEAWTVETRVLRGDPAGGFAAEGPCVFELPEATLVLPPGWPVGRVDDRGTIDAERR